MRMYVRLITMLYDTGPLFTSVFVFNLTGYQTLTNESVYRNWQEYVDDSNLIIKYSTEHGLDNICHWNLDKLTKVKQLK